MNYKNGFFQLLIKEDGTYVKVYPKLNDGNQLNIEEIMQYLTKKNKSNYDLQSLNKTLMSAQVPTEVKIMSEKIAPEDESVFLSVSNDRMSVMGRFYPPSSNGKLLGIREIESELSKLGVKYGILHDSIEVFLKHRQFCTDVLLAKGKPPIQGKSAEITYHFNTDINNKPKINEDGSVDFHHLEAISGVSKGDVLATLEPASDGEIGVDIFGTEIKPLKVQKRVLKHGRNAHLSDDGTIMYSDVSGHVSLTDDKVFVSDTYEVLADVDSSTGDIDYDGNVTVKGNVITGFSVRAKGDIVINGVVEGAYLEAEGQIILNRGMQGMNRGVLKANGNIVSKFFENATVIAGGNVEADAIMHSKVSAGGDVVVNGKRGLITGGEVKSATMISAKTIGSAMGTTTVIEVGINPAILEEYRELEKEIPKWENEKERFAQAINMYRIKLSRGEKIPSDKIAHIKAINDSYSILSKKIDESALRCEELQCKMNNLNGGCVKVSNMAFSGVKIVISNVVYFVRGDVHHSKFVRDGADIRTQGL